jgi:stress response protein YsnF
MHLIQEQVAEVPVVQELQQVIQSYKEQEEQVYQTQFLVLQYFTQEAAAEAAAVLHQRQEVMEVLL